MSMEVKGTCSESMFRRFLIVSFPEALLISILFSLKWGSNSLVQYLGHSDMTLAVTNFGSAAFPHTNFA